jgi:hypothetical protein
MHEGNDAEVLERRGCIVNILAFEGAHQVAPLSSQIETLRWLIYGENKEENAQQYPAGEHLKVPTDE